jgi:hypothetical protein
MISPGACGIRSDGTLVAGWIGGAVLKAARDAPAHGGPRMVSVQPENLLAERLRIDSSRVFDCAFDLRQNEARSFAIIL